MTVEESAKELLNTYINNIKGEDDKLIITEPVKKDYHYETGIMEDSVKIKVLVYFGKKGVKTVLQGNAASHLYKKLKSIIFNQTELNLPVEDVEEPEEYIGTDESGKGDFFGPLVTASVYVNGKSKPALAWIGVRDSKLLNDNQIDFMAGKIKSVLTDAYDIILISPQKYNELYAKFGNLNKLLNWSHTKAIENLLQNKKCSKIIVDKFSSRPIILKQISQSFNIEIYQTTKAERYTAVAAASILARNAFNNWFKSKANRKYSMPKGASAEVDKAAKIIKQNNGEETLRKLVKVHFKNFKRLNINRNY